MKIIVKPELEAKLKGEFESLFKQARDGKFKVTRRSKVKWRIYTNRHMGNWELFNRFKTENISSYVFGDHIEFSWPNCVSVECLLVTNI